MTPEPAATLADGLARLWRRAPALSVSWINHHSLVQLLQDDDSMLDRLDLLGVDGTLLARLAKVPVRTSADLVLPLLLPQLQDARVVLVGGRPGHAARSAAVVASLLAPGARVIDVRDGFGERPEDVGGWIRATGADVVLAGLGGGLQERFVLEATASMPRGLALTCGGWLDQLLTPRYYPAWAYPLHLNWAVRMAREPRRLWRRYTIEALTALARRRTLRSAVHRAPGTAKMLDLSQAGVFGSAAPGGLSARPDASAEPGRGCCS